MIFGHIPEWMAKENPAFALAVAKYYSLRSGKQHRAIVGEVAYWQASLQLLKQLHPEPDWDQERVRFLDGATGEWLEYERARHSKGKRRSELERQRARLARIKAELAEKDLALRDGDEMETAAVLDCLRVVCQRIRSKFQVSLPRIAKAGYESPSLAEAMHRIRAEYDGVLAELGSLEPSNFDASNTLHVVSENGESDREPPPFPA